jgi:thiol-disulfide isomerase/thioredoxin
MKLRSLVVPTVLVAVVAGMAASRMCGSGCMVADAGAALGVIRPVALNEPAKPGQAAPSAGLKVGDKAPELKVDAWVKGEAVTSFESGKVYVVEFWATWCPPCIRAIPHMTELQKKYDEKGKGKVTMIAVAASERGEASARETNLRSFVEKQGDKMGYRVAFDGDRESAAAWMKAAGVGTIPTAFIVAGDGKVAWFGSPLDDDFEKELEKAFAGVNKG